MLGLKIWICSLIMTWMIGTSAGFTMTSIPLSTRGTKPSSSLVVLEATNAIIMEAPAVLDKPEVKKESKPKEKQKDLGSEGWEVRLYNDPFNKREFVARCLMEIVGLSETSSYQVMMQAHQNGIAAIGRYHRERAELYRDRLVGEGLVCDMIPVDDDK